MKKLILLAALSVLLTACGGGDPHAGHAGHTGVGWAEPVKIDVQIDPAEPQAGQPVTIKAKVTQAGEPVNDAEEVVFEIWAEGAGDAEHDEVEGKLEGDGVYAVVQTFPEPGKYYIVPHVTARTFHTMPTIEVNVR
jgi:hypothetical protein